MASGFLAKQIAAHQMLLDELVDERVLQSLPGREALQAELDVMLEQLPEDDPERQVETLRRFQRAAIFRIAVADLTKDEDIRGLGEKVQREAGRVDILVLCGGAIAHGPLEKASLADLCGSASASSVLIARRWPASARCTAMVVLPDPPLRATTATVCMTPAPMLKPLPKGRNASRCVGVRFSASTLLTGAAGARSSRN